MFNLSFLNAGILVASIAALVPLLIHLFAKQKPKKIYFSSLMFIKKSLQERHKSIKLRNILLIIIRTLIILLTILAIARPTVKIPFLKNKGAHKDTAIAIIMDNSLSMDYLVDNETELQKAKIIAKNINNMLTDKDVSVLLTRDNSWNLLNSHLVHGQIDDKLFDTIDIVWQSQKLSELINLATEKLTASHYLNKEIYVISDVQDENDKFEDFDIPVFFIPSSDLQNRRNIACINSKVQSNLVEQAIQRRIMFDIQNFADENINNIMVKLILNSSVVAEKMINLNAKQVRNDSFIISTPQIGWNYGWIEIQDERFTPDNRHYFSFYIEQDINVAVFSDKDRHLPKAVQSILRLYGAKTDYIDMQSFSAEQIADYSFFILDLKQFSPQLKLLLSQLKEQGKNALFVMNKGMNHHDITWLENISGASINQVDNEELELTYINTHHPLMQVFKAEHSKNQKLVPAYLIKPSSNANTLLHAKQNIIALENYFIFWNIDFKKDSDFLYDSFFPVFAYQTMQYINMNSAYKKSYLCGDNIELFDAALTENFNQAIDYKKSTYSFVKPGIYEVKEKGKKTNFYSVNQGSYVESTYKRIAKLDKSIISLLDQKWRDSILQNRLGIELWKYLFFIVLMLIVLEMLIVKKHEKRNR
ncbi:MAG: BatA domain-containing protein [Candidatus Cloacimonetes bacterium]|nr:BatA domain-containing protein [Candidatus Cloacimonadota bacterium]